LITLLIDNNVRECNARSSVRAKPWRSEKHEAKDSDSQKDKRWALKTIGSNALLLHNRLFPGRSAAAT
jgi:hypothetical protein